MWMECITGLILALVLSLGLTRLMISLAPKFGLMDQPGTRRIHSEAIPRAGGIAIWLSFMIVAGLDVALDWFQKDDFVTPRWLGAFLVSSLVLLAAGVVDDRRGLSPWLKLGAHILAPVLFFLVQPVNTGLFPPEWHPYGDFLVFVVWSVVLINAFNLIDGLDGLCGGLAALACLALAGIAISLDRIDAAIVLLIMGGAILGFLRYNLNPARIFLGDAGSMILGFFIATAATEAVGRRAVVGVMLLPIAVAGVPLLDVLLALWRRAARRLARQLRGEEAPGGLFDADKDHLHHRLLTTSGSQHKVALILHGVAILLATLAFLPMLFGDEIIGFSLVGIIIVGLIGMRHLARIEFAQSGSIVHLAIKLPVRRRRAAFALFLYDLFALAAAAGLAVLIETNRFTLSKDVDLLVRFIIVFTILGSAGTLMSRVHARLWVRATIRDVVSLQFWLLVAAAGTFTLCSIGFGAVEWSMLRLSLLGFVFAVCALCLPRVSLELIRDIGLEARHREQMTHQDEDYGPVAILGAGDLGTLFLDHLKSSPHDLYPGMKILGFLDDAKELRGRKLRSFRILGGVEEIPRLVKDSCLKGIVLAIKQPGPGLIDELNRLASTHHLRIHHWQVGLHPLAPANTPPAHGESL